MSRQNILKLPKSYYTKTVYLKQKIQNMKNNKISAFTLVELIVVITILAVLATVAFISFQGYSWDSRDTKRLADMKTIYSGLNYYSLSTGQNYPLPSDRVNITMSWSTNILFYQWSMDKKIQESINIFWDVKDPVSWDYYTYSTNISGTKFSILWKMESSTSHLNNANVYANEPVIQWFWKWVWAILDNQNNFITSDLDISTVSDGQYSIAYETTTLKNIDKNQLVSIWVSNNKDLSYLDESLWLYYDMQTLRDGKLRDFWKYNLDLTLTGGISVGKVNWLSWMATYFDGNDDYFYTLDSSVFEPQNFTINVLLKPKLSGAHDYIFQKWCPSSICNYSGFSMTTLYTDKLRTFFMYKNDSDVTTLEQIISGFEINNNYQLFTSTYDGNTIKTYVNGEFKEEVSASWSTIYYEDDFMLIWKTCPLEWCNSGLYHGIIDEVKVYEKALEPEEIKSIYNNFILN